MKVSNCQNPAKNDNSRESVTLDGCRDPAKNGNSREYVTVDGCQDPAKNDNSRESVTVDGYRDSAKSDNCQNPAKNGSSRDSVTVDGYRDSAKSDNCQETVKTDGYQDHMTVAGVHAPMMPRNNQISLKKADYQMLVDAMKASSLEKLCESYAFSFGLLLRLMIEDSELPVRVLYEKLGVTKTYFYDVLKGKSKPPPAEKQFALIRLLHPASKVRALFFDLAAQERGEFPADLQQHISENHLTDTLRNQFKL